MYYSSAVLISLCSSASAGLSSSDRHGAASTTSRQAFPTAAVCPRFDARCTSSSMLCMPSSTVLTGYSARIASPAIIRRVESRMFETRPSSAIGRRRSSRRWGLAYPGEARRKGDFAVNAAGDGAERPPFDIGRVEFLSGNRALIAENALMGTAEMRDEDGDVYMSFHGKPGIPLYSPKSASAYGKLLAARFDRGPCPMTLS